MKINPSARNRSRPTHRILDGAQLQAVAELFDVLSEQSRLRILQILQSGPASVGELVEASGFKQANVSKQLRILSASGIVARRKEGNRAIFSIKLPLVFELCDLVCRGVAAQAAENAAVLRITGNDSRKNILPPSNDR